MDKMVYPAILQVQLYEVVARAMVEVNYISTAGEYCDKMIQIIRSNEYKSMDHRIAQLKAHIARGKGQYKEALKQYQTAYNIAGKKLIKEFERRLDGELSIEPIESGTSVIIRFESLFSS